MSYNTSSQTVTSSGSSIPRTPSSQIDTRGKATSVQASRSASTRSAFQRSQQTRDDQASRGRSNLRRSQTSRSLSRGHVRSESAELESLTSFPPSSTKSHRDASPTTSSDTGGSSRRRRHLRRTKLIMDELSRSPPEHRIAFITNACQILDHYDIQDHNSELSLGVATVLVNRIQATSQQEEVRMLVSALEMVLRATTQSLQIAYEAWPPKFLERLSSLLESYETQRGIPHAEISSLNLLKILTSLARVADLKPVLLKTPGMRSILLRLNRQQHRVPRLKLLHQLVQNETNQVHVLTHETTLTNLILHIAHHDNDASRQYSAAIIMELASSSLSNQTQMAHDDKMLDTITKLVLTEVQAGTREAVLTALQNIAFVHENRMRLVTYKKGIVLQALQTSLTNGNDYSKARRRAAGALTNLACDATSTIMANHEGLLDALAVTSTSGKVDEVQTRASLALTKIAGGLSVSMDCFPAILDALVVASLSPSAGNVAAMLRLKARLPENRSAMAQHPGLLDTLADLSHGPHRNHAVRALMHLANESSNHPLLGHVPSILHALVKAGGADDDEDSRDCALVALERLALTASIRPHLARHEGLLTMVARAVEREAHEPQQEDKNYLAKPLLMSLLVAM